MFKFWILIQHTVYTVNSQTCFVLYSTELIGKQGTHTVFFIEMANFLLVIPQVTALAYIIEETDR